MTNCVQLDFIEQKTPEIILGDCLDEMKKMADNSIDFIVTDPPFGISFLSKHWDHQIPSHEYWKEMLRVCKHGSMMACAGLPRMIHRLGCIIEDSGWIIRDMIMHLFGQGFPKSHNHFGFEGYGTALKPSWEGWLLCMKPLDGTYKENAEKWGVAGINIEDSRVEGKRWPSNLILDEEYIPLLCLKNSIPNDIIEVIKEYFYDYKMPSLSKRIQDIPFSFEGKQGSILQQDVLLQGIEQSEQGRESFHVGKETQERIDRENEKTPHQEGMEQSNFQGLLDGLGISLCEHPSTTRKSTDYCKTDVESGWNSGTSINDGVEIGKTSSTLGACSPYQWSEKRQQNGEFGSIGQFNTQKGTQRNFKRTSSIEKRERRIEILACDIPEKWIKYFEKTGYKIRSPYCAAEMLDQQSGILKSGSGNRRPNGGGNMFNGFKPINAEFESSLGGASRFFYCAKSSPSERKNYNTHPTVKPISLMKYIIKLLAPPGNPMLLDPFAGSGTTLIAAKELGINAIGIEKELEYFEIAKARIA